MWNIISHVGSDARRLGGTPLPLFHNHDVPMFKLFHVVVMLHVVSPMVEHPGVYFV
jgi:hypothetical protein